MILSMGSQANLFLIAIAAGFFVAFVYDIFRILRKTIKHKNIFVQIEDTVYWLMASFVMFFIMLNKNQGEIRLFSIVGCAIGMSLYFCTVSPIIIKASVTVLQFFKKVFLVTLHIIWSPIRIVLRILAVPMGVVSKSVKKAQAVFKSQLRIKRIKIKNNWRIIRKKT